MAKSKRNRPVKGKPRTRARVRAPPTMTPYQRILVDPCNAELTRPYSGEMGIVQRFVYDGTLNTDVATRTCGYMILQPQRPSQAKIALNASVDAAAIAYDGFAPGYSFVSANGAKLRCHAACVQLFASGASFSNLTGEWAVGVLSCDTLPQGASVSADLLFQLSNQRGVLTKEGVEVKWQPGNLDHTYNTVSEALTADNNLIFVAYRGFPAGVGLSYRYTSVLEWTPKVGVGIPGTAAVTAGVNHTAQVAALSSRSAGWWHKPAHDVLEDLGLTARYVARQGMAMAARAATSKLNSVFGAMMI